MEGRWFRSQLHVEVSLVKVLNPKLSPLLHEYSCEWLCAGGALHGSLRHHCVNVCELANDGLCSKVLRVVNNNRKGLLIHLIRNTASTLNHLI